MSVAVLTHLRTLIDSDHLVCDPSTPTGCQRCIIRQPTICCELCNPEHFKDFARSDPRLRPKRLRNRSHIPDYKADQHDMSLRDALNEFREQETIKKFGKSRLKNSGPGLIMPNNILQRIVDCVHAQKINSKDDLQLETRWSRVDLFADAVLAIIDMCRRPPLTPSAANDNASPATNVKKAPKIGQSRCGACGEVGHNSAYQKFLLRGYILTFPLQGQTLVARSTPQRAKRISHHTPLRLLLHVRLWQSCHQTHHHQAHFGSVYLILFLGMKPLLLSLLLPHLLPSILMYSTILGL